MQEAGSIDATRRSITMHIKIIMDLENIISSYTTFKNNTKSSSKTTVHLSTEPSLIFCVTKLYTD